MNDGTAEYEVATHESVAKLIAQTADFTRYAVGSLAIAVSRQNGIDPKVLFEDMIMILGCAAGPTDLQRIWIAEFEKDIRQAQAEA